MNIFFAKHKLFSTDNYTYLSILARYIGINNVLPAAAQCYLSV